MTRAAKLASLVAIFGSTCGAGRVPPTFEPLTGPRASLRISPAVAILPIGGHVEARAVLRIRDPQRELAGCPSIYWYWGDEGCSKDEPTCDPYQLIDAAATEFRIPAWHKYYEPGEMQVRVLVASNGRVRASDTGTIRIAGPGQ